MPDEQGVYHNLDYLAWTVGQLFHFASAFTGVSKRTKIVAFTH